MPHTFSVLSNYDVSAGSASINDKLLSVLSNMRKKLEIKECDAAEIFLSDVISKMLLVPLIQSSVYYAATDRGMGEENVEVDLAAGMIITSAVLPVVMEVNSSSANKIMEQIGSLDVKLFPNGASTISSEFKQSLPTMGINCADLGIFQFERMSFCVDNPTNLGDGLYVATTYVQDRADTVLDIKSMERALDNGHSNIAKMMCLEGENSDVFNQYGIVVGQRVSRSTTQVMCIIIQFSTYICMPSRMTKGIFAAEKLNFMLIHWLMRYFILRIGNCSQVTQIRLYQLKRPLH
jgi:hypothetical protein